MSFIPPKMIDQNTGFQLNILPANGYFSNSCPDVIYRYRDLALFFLDYPVEVGEQMILEILGKRGKPVVLLEHGACLG